ncbi:MAG: hypothetical protein SGPRY_006726, partial [Prymnesium sp.]
VDVRFCHTGETVSLPLEQVAPWQSRDPQQYKGKPKIEREYKEAVKVAQELALDMVDEDVPIDHVAAALEFNDGSNAAVFDRAQGHRMQKKIRTQKSQHAAKMRQKHKDASFHPGDIVWVKVESWPWWPSRVLDTRGLIADEPTLSLHLLKQLKCSLPLVDKQGAKAIVHWNDMQAPLDPELPKADKLKYRGAVKEAQSLVKSVTTASNHKKSDDQFVKEHQRKRARGRAAAGSVRKLTRGSLVWAKITKTHKWWPSQVRSVRSLDDEVPAMRIRMLFTDEDFELPVKQILPWGEREAEDPSKLKLSKQKKLEYHGALEKALTIAAQQCYGAAEEVFSDDAYEEEEAGDDGFDDSEESNQFNESAFCQQPRLSDGQPAAAMTFPCGSLVWVKIHGFPWWPSKVYSTTHITEAAPKLQVLLLFKDEKTLVSLADSKGVPMVVPWRGRTVLEPSKATKSKSLRKQYASALRIAQSMAAESAVDGNEAWSDDHDDDQEFDDHGDEDEENADDGRVQKKIRRYADKRLATRASQRAGRKDSGKEGWVGPCESVGADGERFYDAIRIGGHVFHLGDDVLVKASEGHVNQLWACKIEALWQNFPCLPNMSTFGVGRRELFESVVTEENPVDTISAPCRVLSWSAYQQWLTEEIADEAEDDEHAKYQPGTGEFMPLTGNSCLAEVARIGTFHQRIDQEHLHDTSNTPGKDGPSNKRLQPMGATVTQMQVKRSRLGRFAEAAARLLPSSSPERMPCREKERGDVIGALRAALLEGTLGSSLYLSGTPGTGKTATVHQALRELAADDSLPSFRTIEVNGMKLSSPYQVYSLLWQALTGQASTPQKALSSLEHRFSTDGVTSKKPNEKLVMVLDEIDYLVTRKQSVIYNMFDWATSAGSSLIIVGISNTMDLPERWLQSLEMSAVPSKYVALRHRLQSVKKQTQ